MRCSARIFDKKMITRKKNKYDDFEILTDFENLYEAHKSCRKGKRWKDSVATYDLRDLECTLYLQYLLKSGKYKISKYHCFKVNERGKERDIKSTQYKDRIVQKCLHEKIIIPRIAPTFIYDNGASLKGKGTDFQLDRLKEHLRQYVAKNGTDGYILVGDFSGYFDSIAHDFVNSFYAKEFSDERILQLIYAIHATIPGGVGVPLGNQLSQDDGLIAASPIDHMVKERLRTKGYGRYNDDFYAIHQSKEHLKHCWFEIDKMATDMGLKLNEKKTKIVPITTGINFLGFHTHVTQSGKIARRIKAKSKSRQRQRLRKFKKKVDAGEMTLEDAKAGYQSWKAHAKRGDTYYLLQEMDCYFYSLFYEYLTEAEKERYKKLQRHRQSRIKRRNKKCQSY